MEDICVSAPAKVILHGEHAVVYGQPAIAACLNLRTFLHMKRTVENCDNVILDLPNIQIQKSWSLDKIQSLFKFPIGDIGEPGGPTEDQLKILMELGEENLALVTFLYLYIAIIGQSGRLRPLTFKANSSIPIGAGLGSSASFSVTLVTALLLQEGLISPPTQSSKMGSTCTSAWSASDLECINKWAFQGERIMHGSPSGIDNSVSTFGGALKFQSGKISFLESMPSFKILLTSTNVARSTKTLVTRVRGLYEQDRAILNPVMEAVGGITEKVQQICSEMSILETPEHFTVLEKLIDDNQRLLQIMCVSHTTIDKICHMTSKYGIHTKLTGAGGGGCTMSLLKPGTKPDMVDKLKDELTKEGFKCWETQIGGQGVQLHNSVAEMEKLAFHGPDS